MNDGYYFWGMHMGWWFFMLVLVVIIAGWVTKSRRKK